MSAFDRLRSTKEQLKDEMVATHKRMTDPEEQEKQQAAKERAERLQELSIDAGL